ncbi:MAG: thiamine phosphate synthase [Candidatus Nanohalarchaeota archaeon]|nr:MAG: thiamine phosphate synthase [Candidatus Nanohaloarchaeota archaeon]
MDTTKIPKLYLITDSAITKQTTEKDTKDALEAGIKIIQYREKNLPEHLILKTAKKLKTLTKKHNALLIINDHPTIAQKIHADGIHLGQTDTPIKEAKKIFKGKIIGISAKTIKQTKQAETDGATYLGIGPIFNTATKKDAGQGIGLETLKQIKNHATIPIVAIGGITKTNAETVLNSGADSIAVISAIIGKDIKKETQKLQAVIQ